MPAASIRRFWLVILIALSVTCACVRPAFAQQGPGAATTTGGTGQTVRTVQGRVVDALHGTPVPRALVHLDARAVLSDAQGRFSFAQFSDPQGYVSVVKPGFTSRAAADGPAMMKVADLDAPLELKMYPDGVITGTVSARDGAALAGIGVQLYRANYDANGISAAQVSYTSTDSHGNYRFQAPAGRYRMVSRYLSSLPETGQAVMATGFPGGSSSVGTGYFALTSGEEKRINLRPFVGTAIAVELKVDGLDGEDRRSRLRVSVEPEGGVPFSTQLQAEEGAGLYRLSLPAGSYTLRATAGSRDEPLEGSARITVTAHETGPVALHVAPLATFPVEIAVSPETQPDPAQPQPSEALTAVQLNLSLHSVGTSLDGFGDIRLRSNDEGGYAFSVPAGRYRLVSPGGSNWTVRSASLGTADLEGGEMTVAGASGGTPIRIVVERASGQVSGTVAMGEAPSVWLYLIALEPSLTPFYMERVGAAGTFTRSVAPGSYLAVAAESRIQEDLRDRAVVDALAVEGKEVTVAAGGKVSVDLPSLVNVGVGR